MKRLIFIIILLPAFIIGASADLDAAARDAGIYGVEDSLTDDARDISGKLDITGGYDTGSALGRLWRRFLDYLVEQLRGSVGDIVGLTAISVFCAMAASLVTDKRLPEYINMAACCAAGVLICGSFGGFVTQTADAITRLSDYSRAAMPAVFTAAAACGAVTSSTAKYTAACLAMDVMISAANKFIIPLIYAFLAVNFSCALFENPMLRALSKLIKWLTTTMMTGLTLAFTAYISFTAVVSGSADAVAVKTAKTVISSTLPVVGGIMSDAASTVLAAAAMIRNSTGVFSLIAVGAMCIGPFALLSVKMTLFKAAGAVADMMPNSHLSSMLRDTGTAVAMLLGLLGCCAAMLFVSFTAAIKAVSP